jgi:hypothetical protein
MLYSLNGARPVPLPFRIHVNGTTRTDPSSFTAEEIAAAGFTGPFIEPPYDPATQSLDWIDGAYVVVDLPPPEPQPQWVEFSATLMGDQQVKVMLIQLVAEDPGCFGGLIAGLNEAAKGDSRVFFGSWDYARQNGFISDTLAESVSVMAAAFNLPEVFVSALFQEDQ